MKTEKLSTGCPTLQSSTSQMIKIGEECNRIKTVYFLVLILLCSFHHCMFYNFLVSFLSFHPASVFMPFLARGHFKILIKHSSFV